MDVSKTQYKTEELGIEEKNNDKKILDIKVKDTNYNAKITEIEGKRPSITGLATTSTLNALENKISNVSDLVKKADYDTKISDI